MPIQVELEDRGLGERVLDVRVHGGEHVRQQFLPAVAERGGHRVRNPPCALATKRLPGHRPHRLPRRHLTSRTRQRHHYGYPMFSTPVISDEIIAAHHLTQPPMPAQGCLGLRVVGVDVGVAAARHRIRAWREPLRRKPRRVRPAADDTLSPSACRGPHRGLLTLRPGVGVQRQRHPRHRRDLTETHYWDRYWSISTLGRTCVSNLKPPTPPTRSKCAWTGPTPCRYPCRGTA
jgi:hypothetical protein